MISVDFEIRENLFKEIDDLAHKLVNGITPEENAIDIERKYKKIYIDNIESKEAPKEIKKPIAKQLLKEDIKNAILRVQKGA